VTVVERFLLVVIFGGAVIALIATGLAVAWLWRRIKDARWKRFRATLFVSPQWDPSDRERRNGRSGGRVA
jgi:hypothetical protein